LWESVREEIREGQVLFREAFGTRTIPTPSPNTDYYIPETGGFHVRAYPCLTWIIFAEGQPVDVEIQHSWDGKTFRKLSGYEIVSADFNPDEDNTIVDRGPLNLEYVRIKVRTGTTAPTSIRGDIKAKWIGG